MNTIFIPKTQGQQICIERPESQRSSLPSSEHFTRNTVIDHYQETGRLDMTLQLQFSRISLHCSNPRLFLFCFYYHVEDNVSHRCFHRDRISWRSLWAPKGRGPLLFPCRQKYQLESWQAQTISCRILVINKLLFKKLNYSSQVDNAAKILFLLHDVSNCKSLQTCSNSKCTQ